MCSFISSTFYDLRLVRLELDKKFLRKCVDMSLYVMKEGDNTGSNESLQNYCYKEISNIDILGTIIGNRFGSISERKKRKRLSNMELKATIEQNKHIFIFYRKSVFVEYETFLLNENNKDIKIQICRQY